MKEPKDMPDLLFDLAKRVQNMLVKKVGLEDALAQHIGFEISRELAENWGGQQIYVPQWLCMMRHSRDEEIWREFNGHNHAALAKKYRISLQWVYSIVKRMRAQELDRRKMKLFED